MNQQQTIDKGRRAELLLESDVYQDALSLVKQAIFDKWENSPIRDTEGQHQLRLMLKCLTEIDAAIKEAAMNGQVELKTIEQQSLFERIKKLAA